MPALLRDMARRRLVAAIKHDSAQHWASYLRAMRTALRVSAEMRAMARALKPA